MRGLTGSVVCGCCWDDEWLQNSNFEAERYAELTSVTCGHPPRYPRAPCSRRYRPDTAFGFAYAQAEDNWQLIEDAMLFYRGNSAL